MKSENGVSREHQFYDESRDEWCEVFEVETYDPEAQMLRVAWNCVYSKGERRLVRWEQKQFSHPEVVGALTGEGFHINNCWGDFSGGQFNPSSRRQVFECSLSPDDI
jgi:hypothetical protein